MPLPRWAARFNKRFTNRFLEPLARRFENFGVVVHRGRRTGRLYRTPVNYFRTGSAGHLIVALTYGPHADWAQNVLTGGGTIETAGGVLRITAAHVVGRPGVWIYLPLPVRFVLRMLRVHSFLLIATELNTSQ